MLELAILPLALPKVRRATSLLAQDDTLKGLLRETRTNGRPQVAPTEEIKIFCFIAYGCAFCDRSDLGRIISSPTILLFIFHHSLFIFTFVGEAISLPRIQMNIMFSSVVKTNKFHFCLHNKKETRGSLLSACFYIALYQIYDRGCRFGLQ